jgi:hypothetical protein
MSSICSRDAHLNVRASSHHCRRASLRVRVEGTVLLSTNPPPSIPSFIILSQEKPTCIAPKMEYRIRIRKDAHSWPSLLSAWPVKCAVPIPLRSAASSTALMQRTSPYGPVGIFYVLTCTCTDLRHSSHSKESLFPLDFPRTPQKPTRSHFLVNSRRGSI